MISLFLIILLILPGLTLNTDAEAAELTPPSAASAPAESISAEGAPTTPPPKRFNIRVQEAPLVIYSLVDRNQIVNAEFMVPYARNVNLGLQVARFGIYREDSYELRSDNVGIRAEYVLGRRGGFGSGFYVSNNVLMGKYDIKTYKAATLADGHTCQRTFASHGQAITAGLTTGFQYFAQSGVNFNAGVGYVKSRTMKTHATSTSSCVDDPGRLDGKPFESPWLDLGLGYAL